MNSNKSNTNNLEHKIFFYSLIASCSVAYLASLINIINQGQWYLSVIIAVAALLFSVLIFLFKYKQKYNSILFPYHFLAIGFMTYVFFEAGGFQSVVLFMFMVHLILLIITSPKNYRKISIAIYLVYNSMFLTIDKFFPEWIQLPHSTTSQVKPYYFIISVVLVTVIVLLLKRDYDLERITIMKQNADIIKINRDLEEKVKDRTRHLKDKNEKLINYAFYNEFKMESPLRSIVGIINLMKKEKEYEEFIDHLESSALELEVMVKEIKDKLRSEQAEVESLNRESGR